MCSMKAVLIGIDSYPIVNKGCVNDVLAMRDILRFKHSVVEQDIRLLTNKRANTDAILERLEWLIDCSNTQKTQNLLFYFSGNGAQIPNRDYAVDIGVNTFDQVLCPVNFDWDYNPGITDSDIQNIISKKNKNCRLVMVFDCSYAGEVFSFGQNPSDVIFKSTTKTISTPVDFLSRVSGFNSNTIVNIVTSGERFWGFVNEANTSEKPSITPRHSIDVPNTILLEACSDYQVAIDADFKTRYQGAFSYCLQKFLYTHPEFSMREVQESTERYLKSFGFSQTPVFNIARETNARRCIITN